MNRKKQLLKYLIADFISANIGWHLLWILIESALEVPISEKYEWYSLSMVVISGVGVSFIWLFLYLVSGYYREVFRKSRLLELWQTFGNSFIGAALIILFLNRILDVDQAEVSLLFVFFIMHFFLTYIPRLVITNLTIRSIQTGNIGFNTVIIGCYNKALNIYKEILSQKISSGNKFIGYIKVDDKTKDLLHGNLPCFGHLDNVKDIIDENDVKEVVIAIETSEHKKMNRIINKLIDTNAVIKVIPGMYDILTGRVRMNSILGTPLIQVSHMLIPPWQENIKTIIDITVSFLALCITFPLSVFLIAGIKISSRGPIMHCQERIGRYGKPFTIYKFRSMYIDAEKNGPGLASKDDERITRFGRFMRKTRFDEIPNFINVIKGDMSLVGPRPERKYFIDQIVKREPNYNHLLKVKPGITSWGQVKFGYAENVEQMTQRLKYDLLYLDNMSLFVDFKIIIHTVITIIRRKGV